MVIERILSSVGIVILSIIVGFIAFYFSSDLSKEQRKKQIEEIASLFINFVLFIWVGKLLVNIPLLLRDPLAALAFPSDSRAFYLAFLFIALNILYKSIRQQLNVTKFINAFTPVFLASSFSYEFIQIVVLEKAYSLGYISLLGVLFILFLLLKERTNVSKIIWLGWTCGVLFLSFYLPFVIIFGYIVHSWFLGLLFIGSLILFSIKKDVF